MDSRRYSLREQIAAGYLARKAARMFGDEYGSPDAEFSDAQYAQLTSSMRDDMESGRFDAYLTGALRVWRERSNGHCPAV